MFEGAVAALLNRLLGTYVEDLDIESFNVGIFSGNAYLTDLKLKPEALVRVIPSSLLKRLLSALAEETFVILMNLA